MLKSVHRIAGLALVVTLFILPVAAQQKETPLPPPDRTPHLVLAHTGPHAPVTAVAFAPDASALYVGGFDKQVRRYERVKGKYVAAGSFRVPIAPGTAGVVNALAVSPDGKWVAAAGRAPMRGETWTSADDGIGQDFRRLAPEVRRDSGVVYLFDPTNPNGGKVLRGQEFEVRAIAFANPAPAGGPVLVTAGIEWSDKKKDSVGVVRVFNVATGAEIASRDDLPSSTIPPGLAAWATGAGKNGLRVAVAWDAVNAKGELLPSKLLTWDNPGTKEEKSDWAAESRLISPLSVRLGKDGAATELLNGGYDSTRNTGGLNVRPAAGGEPRVVPLKSENGRLLLPTAVAALNVEGIGDATALLLPVGSDADGPRYELRLLTPKGESGTTLGGFHRQRPVLSASPDGRFVAVAGFTDNRVEVYTATSLAAGKPVAEKLAGDASGFRKIAFLVGEKLWLGGQDDTPQKGGVVLDLDRNVRAAAPKGAKDELKVDAPKVDAEPERLEPDPAKMLQARVVVTVGGAAKTIELPVGVRATAAALLPGKPAWDPTLGSVVAVAHVEDRSRTALVTIYDVATGLPLVQLGGPTLPVRSLAFSAARALLAGAGEDGTVAIWTLKNVARKWSAIDGLRVAAREGQVVVTSVRAKGAADGKLKVDDVIESVADAKGVQKPVKAPLDFVFAVRALGVGDKAKIKIKGQAALVEVEVGARTGFRHPLFTLWVDPVANAGKHEWVGWTASGPYDASGEASEARIGWLTATGDPARPVTFAGANQYRKLFYKRDILRLLLTTADYNEAIAMIPPPRAPTLVAAPTGPTEDRDGRTVAREKSDGFEVTLNEDPDGVLDLDRAELQWQITGPAGASEWKREPFAAARAVLDLRTYDWKRGEHRVHVKLLNAGDAVPLREITKTVWFVPPAPVVAVNIDGKPAVGAEVETMNDEVEVAAVVDAKGNPDGAGVTVSWTGGAKPIELAPAPGGQFAPTKVKLKPEGTTVIRVTATNRGAGAKAENESHALEVRVRRLAPKAVPPPGIKLLVVTEHDFRTVTDAPFVVSAPRAALAVTVTDANPIAAFEWKIGDGPWEAGKLDPKTQSQTLELDLSKLQKDDDKGVEVRVRAKSAKSEFATDSAVVRYDGLPEVSVKVPPVLVTAPELNISGGLKVTGNRRFTVRVLVTSSRTGRTHEFEPTFNAARTAWGATITLFPGENQIGYVVRYDNDRKELPRAGLVTVQYVRPPIVIGGAPVEVGTGAVGDVAIAVVSSPDVAPAELLLNGTRVGFRTHPKPFRLFGAGLWLLEAKGAAVNPGADRLKPVPLVVRNAEAESRTFALEVRGREEVKTAPPTIRLSHKEKAITPDQGLPPVGYAQFALDLKVNSETRITRVEIWHGLDMNTGLKQTGAVKIADAVAAPAGGFELTARATVVLRAGAANYIRVVASNDGGTAEVAFNVSYAPPPVRVVIDSITEPNGKVTEVRPGSAGELLVEKSVIEVSGRVLWNFDNERVAQDPNLSVVFVANGVAHVPVRVAAAKEGKERTFSGRVYLNTLDPNPKARGVTRVRVELRSGERPLPIPQEGIQQAAITVTSKDPLRRQRLHVLMVGVEVPEAERKALVQRVVTAVGGKIPTGTPNFTHGLFERKEFEFAYLYPPRLEYMKESDLNALLAAVRRDIELRMRRADDAWVNDLIVVYYHGEDWVDKDTGHWLLHSASTLSGAAGKNAAKHAIRLDNLPQVPGMPIAVVNVASADSPGGNLALDLPYLRCAWADAPASGQFLEQFAKAVLVERTFGGIAEYVNKEVAKAARMLRSLPPEGAGSRVVGLP